MSKWHALDGVDFSAEELAGIVVTRWPAVSYSRNTINLSDGLSNPNGDALNNAHVALLPKGAAWGTPDDCPLDVESNLWKFWRSITEPIAGVYRDLWGVAMDSTSVSVNFESGLEDWELEYGLPNACFGSSQSQAVRYKWLRFMVLSTGTITPGDFLNLAAEVGSEVVIEEPEFFEFGFSSLDSPDELGGPEMEHLVIIWPINKDEYGFTFEDSTLGNSPLYDFDSDEVLECVFPGLLSSGYRMHFNYNYNTTFSVQ